MDCFQRKAHNDRVIDMWKKGESLAAIKPQDTWFPPRPIIKKCKKALEILVTEPKTVIKFRKGV